ncbi:Alkaline phosphatase [Bathymodiolus thermophilus thioautotrophic gill symbiont]|uniref:beta strand repeat-containing protein n=1 Tax=Bathymodiolus thermophilus thioautotrophic gill symbiont TaxID=2360 RepID=UPI0010B0933D|nr:Ig-like domain-containing protein [Bathymodiolus thermophilus thioautotrophic gill symbiont]SGZ60811.1 Alkaline phosphatase [Bathymodiolus thermophilus thioautotrophic gill symbiont]
MQIKTPKQIMVLQNKVQKIADKFNEEVVTVTESVQHIQVQTGVVYQLNAKDFDTKKLHLIAKKIGNDLEVTLEEGVVIFDNYFDACSPDLSCLVSLPTEDGGLYHVVADTFFTLEDGTQIVYFYGEQSIVSTESSAVRAGNNKSFYNVIEIVSAIAIMIIAITATGSDNGDDGDNEAVITGNVGLGLIINSSLRVQAFINGAAISDKFIVDTSGKFTITLSESYNQGTIVTLKLTDTTATADYMDEALGTNKDLDSELRATIVIQSGDTKVNITLLTDVATKIITKEANITQELVTNTNTQVATVFGISGDVTTEEVRAVIDKKGFTTTSNAYGQALAVVSQFENDTRADSSYSISTSTVTTTIANALKDGNIANINVKKKLNEAQKTIKDTYPSILLNENFTSLTIQIAEENATKNEALNENQITIVAESGSKVIIVFSANGKTVTRTIDSTSGNTANKVPALIDSELSTLGDGLISILATLIKDGITNSTSTNSFILDTTAPNAPVINMIAENNTINFFKKNATIAGITEFGSSVVLSIAGNNRKTEISGITWHYTLTDADIKAMGQGRENITATTTDVAGNHTTSHARGIMIDTVAPIFDQQPIAINIAVNTLTTTIIYDVQASNFEGGNADEGVTYSIKNAEDSKFLINANTGIITYRTIQTSVHDDTITIIATDAAGNTKEQSITVSVKDIDLSTSVVWNHIGNSNINIDKLATATLSGTVAIIGTVTDLSIKSIIFKQENAVVYTIDADLPEIVNGIWTLANNNSWTAQLSNGSYTVIVHLSGNNGSITGRGITTATVTVDTIAPTQPTITLTNDTGSDGSDYITNDMTVSISDLGVDNTRVYSLEKDDNKIINVTSKANYTAYMEDAKDATYKLTVTDIDAIGNTTSSNTLAFELDTVSQTLTTDMGTGKNLSGNKLFTNNNTVTIDNLELKATWQYSTNGSAFIDGIGNSFTLADDTYEIGSIRIKHTDVAGNVSAIKNQDHTLVIDTEVPVFDQIDPVTGKLIGAKNIFVNGPFTAPIFDAQARNNSKENPDKDITYSIKEEGSKFKITPDSGILTYKERQTSASSNAITIIATDLAGNTEEYTVSSSVILPTAQGFIMNSKRSRDLSGVSSSSASNDDDLDGAKDADPDGKAQTDKSYVASSKTNTKAVNVTDISEDKGVITTHAINLQGDDNDNTLIGSLANELFVAGLGNDTLIGNGGTDAFNAGAGDDTIVINDDNLAKLSSNPLSGNLLARVDGGSNTDTLKLEGSNLSLDLTNIDNSRIQDIEIIDLTGSGNNTLKLNLNDLLDISSETNVLKVMGDSGDKVDIELNDNAFVRDSASETENGITYHIYSNANDSTAELWIDQDLGVM